ncbi:putative regulatory protein, FmdB family [Micrococcus luteus]|uniref:Regulatory protein, FmdB family n=1 Tax=Micrococcus luteus TaxID=1270 RepID=A0ABD7M7Q2_MICLU|nr:MULTISPECIES: FmdB family zinc ribbon protein [Micrococcus]MCV7525345.1 FmdB family transcriptional regulator [Micrococcus luteus]MCV7536666.1 FmdB family transcriptional regulator [Micrococcus luteus]MCV7563780.1 FmdB family transcriptional regulator [Micrococcus luteus]MCV7575655.1 FmdB family transcriptional regulator [Micrococcus luteus]MCV7602574.1 FmdB family transcriptional regulator [Micrococcus luteus]
MPTYAYRCKDCGHAFDAVQAFTDDALTECPACGGVLRKQYGSVGVSFKGSGFYRTDSRSGTGSAGGSTSDSAAGSSTSSTSSSASAAAD